MSAGSNARLAAELDRAVGAVSRLGLRPVAWDDGVVQVEHVFNDAPHFAVWVIASDGHDKAERVDAGGIEAAVIRKRAEAARRKEARRG